MTLLKDEYLVTMSHRSKTLVAVSSVPIDRILLGTHMSNSDDRPPSSDAFQRFLNKLEEY